MHPNLSFEQAPPISVPLRFFLTAPLFGMAAGLLLFFMGGGMLASRWMPGALAATHLLVVGFMLQAMCGALLQFIPVAAGGNVWRPALVAGIVHPLLVLAVILLVAAFLGQGQALFMAAVAGFVLGLGLYLIVVGNALWRTSAQGGTLLALRIAVMGLLVTLGLGITLATGLAGLAADPLPLLSLTDIHAAWGLGGWSLVLLAGVSYYVVPMFQLTPAYPAWLARSLPLALLAVLLLWSLQLVDVSADNRMAILLGGLGIAGMFAMETLYLQSRRRRKVRDVTLLFFRVAMLSLLGLLLSAVTFALLPDLWNDPRATVWLGMLAIVGVFVSAIGGMLYKIVPFLCWLHLQRLCAAHSLPPTMNQMIAEPAMRRHYFVHLFALGLLLAAAWAPAVARPAGLILAADFLLLWLNLLGALRSYRRFKDRIPASA